MRVSRRSVRRLPHTAAALIALGAGAGSASGAPGVYEPGADPGLGFNLISWWDFGAQGPSLWENAVQDMFDAGFRSVSISPVRFAQISGPSAGSILPTANQSPPLSHVEAGARRAKQLGMTVTVNPFVELVDGNSFFPMWRGFYNPAPGSAEAGRFWADYTGYLTEVAEMAQRTGADFMTVGTEYKTLVQDPGHNADWASTIAAVDSVFDGKLGYAANWDNFKHPNLTEAIWEHPAIDFVGIDAYFRNVSAADADQSADPGFLDIVEAAWNQQLDGDILPFARSLAGGAGKPVALTEFGFLPFNRGSAQQGEPGIIDTDEQIKAFRGLLAALDGRRAAGEVLFTDVWQWGQAGTDGSLWNMSVGPSANQPNNIPATQFLSAFVSSPALVGDLNGDGFVGAGDLDILLALWNQGVGSGEPADLSGDGFVGAGDLDILLGAWNTALAEAGVASAAVPEPAAAWLLLAPLALRRRFNLRTPVGGVAGALAPSYRA